MSCGSFILAKHFVNWVSGRVERRARTLAGAGSARGIGGVSAWARQIAQSGSHAGLSLPASDRRAGPAGLPFVPRDSANRLGAGAGPSRRAGGRPAQPTAKALRQWTQPPRRLQHGNAGDRPPACAHDHVARPQPRLCRRRACGHARDDYATRRRRPLRRRAGRVRPARRETHGGPCRIRSDQPRSAGRDPPGWHNSFRRKPASHPATPVQMPTTSPFKLTRGPPECTECRARVCLEQIQARRRGSVAPRTQDARRDRGRSSRRLPDRRPASHPAPDDPDRPTEPLSASGPRDRSKGPRGLTPGRGESREPISSRPSARMTDAREEPIKTRSVVRT